MLKMLLEQKRVYEEQIKEMHGNLAVVLTNIEELLAAKLQELRTLQGKDTGAVNLIFEGYKITETIPKKVVWDQEKLNALFDRIAAAGDDPRSYMKMKLEVQERMYDKMLDGVKELFAEARTVTPGKATFAFEEVGNA